MTIFEPLTTWQLAFLGSYAALILISMTRHLVCSYEMRRAVFLRPDSQPMSDPQPPLVSILVPAKDEAETIEICVRSLLDQDYPNFELLVIDDRSTDGTPQIVEALAAQDSRVRLIRIDHLPAGWTGKTHALHVGQAHAEGDWLLFVDADTRHHPACVGVVVDAAQRGRYDMLSLMPSLEMRSFWEKVIQPFAATCLLVLFPLSRVNNPRREHSGFANGQFILFRREAYDEVGGHAAVRDKFVEDIYLGRRVRRNGLRLLVAAGTSLFSVRMYSTLPAIVNGWSRILYSAVGARPGKLYALIAFICAFSVLPYVVIVGSAAAILAGLAMPFSAILLAMGVIHELSQLVLYARTYAVTGSPIRYLVFRWLAVFAMLCILARTIRTCGTHEITWRGTSYERNLQTATGDAAALESAEST